MKAAAKLMLRAVGYPLSLGARRLPHGAHITRYVMYETLTDFLAKEDSATKKCLSISHSDRLVRLLGLKQTQLEEAAYPEHDAANLRSFSDNSFDFIVSDQVLEHVEGGGHRVFEESYRVLRRGGVAVHTTCFTNPIHGWPSDYWRFTPRGLETLARSSGLTDVLAVGGHGSRLVWIADLLGLRDVPVPHAKWHPLHMIATFNMEAWPTSTWIVARK